MPRQARGPYLYLDPKRRTWTIRDGSRAIRTSCGEGERPKAEGHLAEFLGRKHRPKPSADPLIDDVLNVYATEHGPHTRRPSNVAYTVSNLLRWWSGKRVSDIGAKNCRAYASQKSTTAARRDIETLRAAVGYWHREGYGPLPIMPAFILPNKPEPRDRWLTRHEAARLLWASRRTEHLRRFILIGLYTGSRSGVILALKWDWIDLDRGIMRRRAPGESESNKRRPPVKLGKRILSHLRRWYRIDEQRGDCGNLPVLHYKGQLVQKMRRSWRTAVARAGLDPSVTPHTLRHTRATWMMQAGIDPWEAAGALGLSLEMISRTYGHHHSDHQRRAAEV